MPSIDFDSEAANTWLECMRIAHKSGVADKLPHRRAANREESEMARAVARRLDRSLFALPVAPVAGESEAPSEHSDTPECCRCGSTDAELRLWRTIWPSHEPRYDLWVCRFGCSA